MYLFSVALLVYRMLSHVTKHIIGPHISNIRKVQYKTSIKDITRIEIRQTVGRTQNAVEPKRQKILPDVIGWKTQRQGSRQEANPHPPTPRGDPSQE